MAEIKVTLYGEDTISLLELLEGAEVIRVQIGDVEYFPRGAASTGRVPGPVVIGPPGTDPGEIAAALQSMAVEIPTPPENGYVIGKFSMPYEKWLALRPLIEPLLAEETTRG